MCAASTWQHDSIVNVGQINTQDWIRAADELTQSLLLSGAINSVAGKPKVMMIGRIKNNTNQHIDTDSLMKKIRVALNKGGRALTTTAVGLDGPEDESSKAVRELRADDEFNHCLLYTSPSPRDQRGSRMPSSA